MYADQWYLGNINLESALEALSETETQDDLKPIKIAIIDSGINQDHPDLQPSLLSGFNYIEPELPPFDDFGEGTHVAGLIGAVQNNGIGIVGVAPTVKIEPYKILNT